MNEMRCIKCGCVSEAPLCVEHFYEEFEKQTGKKPEWQFDDKKQEWEQVYKGDKKQEWEQVCKNLVSNLSSSKKL